MRRSYPGVHNAVQVSETGGRLEWRPVRRLAPVRPGSGGRTFPKNHHTRATDQAGRPRRPFAFGRVPPKGTRLNATRALDAVTTQKPNAVHRSIEEAVMIRGTFHELHALFGILAAVIAIPAGCSSDQFEGCKASRTCPPSKGGASGVGGDGESGDTNTGGGSGETNTGGSSGTGTGGSTGSSGTAGGEGGSGGADDDSAPPTIVSIAPADGDVDVERDITVTVTFSEPIDERTVTETSVALSGPDGEVSGTISVDGDVISFVPEQKLNLLGTYVLGIDETIADLEGNTLSESTSAEFRVRDGRWSEPEYPFGRTESQVAGYFQRNARGDIVMSIGKAQLGDILGTVFNAESREWSPAQDLPGTSNSYQISPDAIDAVGRGVIAYTKDVVHGWFRSTKEGVWVNAGALDGYPVVGTTSTGLATAAWRTSSGVETRTLDLEDGALEAPAGFELEGVYNGPYLVASLDRMAILATSRSSANGEELWISWKAGAAWNEPELLASAPTMRELYFDSDEQGNIIVIWFENDRAWSRIYERKNDAWTRELLVFETSSDASVSSLDMTAGSALVSLSTGEPSIWAAVYEAGIGWSDASLVRLDGLSAWVGTALDHAGNGIAMWAVNDTLQFRRFVAGVGWQKPSWFTAPIQHLGFVFGATAPDGSVTAVANARLAETYAPWAVRFE